MLLLPVRCGACHRPSASPCPRCLPKLLLAPPIEAPPPLAQLVALLSYEGPARSIVAGLKVRHNRGAQRWLAGGLALLVPSGTDLITWAPTSPVRIAARGVDHARLLAQAVAAAAGVRCHSTLTRLPGPPQTGRTRAARLEDGPRFVARYDLCGLAVVVVDDVTTTGATLAAAGRGLVAAGAASVSGLAAASTPRPNRAPHRRYGPFDSTDPQGGPPSGRREKHARSSGRHPLRSGPQGRGEGCQAGAGGAG